jgi:hypothetical protein
MNAASNAGTNVPAFLFCRRQAAKLALRRMSPEMIDDQTDATSVEKTEEDDLPPPPPPVRYWRPAEEPTCCGSGCIDCPF